MHNLIFGNPVVNVDRDRIYFIFAGLTLRFAFDVCYVAYLNVYFEYHFLTPFKLNTESFRYLESIFWVLFPLLFLPFNTKNLSGLYFGIFLMFLYLPLTSMFGLDVERGRETIILCMISVLVSIAVLKIPIGKLKIPVIRNGNLIVVIISTIMTVYFILLSASHGLLFEMNFDLSQIYLIREKASEVLDVGFFTYLNLWTQKIFVPILLIVGLQRKSLLIIVFSLTMHAVFFGVTQHRMHLFVPILIIMVWFVFSKGYKVATGLFVVAVTIVVLSLVVRFFELEQVGAIVLRRAFFVGASVTDSWVTYFSENPKVYFADRFFSSFVVNQYTGTILPYYLGEIFHKPGSDLSFNVGLIGAGYAQLGTTGVVFYALVFSLMIRINNALIENGVPAILPAAIIVLPIRIAWVDSDIFTALLSHGIIIGTLMVWLYGRPKASR